MVAVAADPLLLSELLHLFLKTILRQNRMLLPCWGTVFGWSITIPPNQSCPIIRDTFSMLDAICILIGIISGAVRVITTNGIIFQ